MPVANWKKAVPDPASPELVPCMSWFSLSAATTGHLCGLVVQAEDLAHQKDFTY